jgi:hypothetical protein
VRARRTALGPCPMLRRTASVPTAWQSPLRAPQPGRQPSEVAWSSRLLAATCTRARVHVGCPRSAEVYRGHSWKFSPRHVTHPALQVQSACESADRCSVRPGQGRRTCHVQVPVRDLVPQRRSHGQIEVEVDAAPCNGIASMRLGLPTGSANAESSLGQRDGWGEFARGRRRPTLIRD